MEKLEKYHEDALLSEQEFLDKRNTLREEYEKAREEASGKTKENDFLSKEDQKRGFFVRLSRSFFKMDAGKPLMQVSGDSPLFFPFRAQSRYGPAE